MTNEEIIKRMEDITNQIENNYNSVRNCVKNNNEDISVINQVVVNMEYPYDYDNPYEKVKIAINNMSNFMINDCEIKNKLLWNEYNDLQNQLNLIKKE